MTRLEIDSLRQDSKAAMKIASALTAQNIKPMTFEPVGTEKSVVKVKRANKSGVVVRSYANYQ